MAPDAASGAGGDPWAALDRALPITLLPVRLETRWFVGASDAELELRVRLFPDAIHLANPRAVPATERDVVVAYWRARGRTSEADPVVRARWDRLVADLGAARAAWLRDRLTPAQGPDGDLRFPDVATDDTPRPPTARGLPDRFLVVAQGTGATVARAWGQRIPRDLPIADASATWTTDFAQAEQLGLAVRLRITRAAATGVAQIIALGVRTGDPDHVLATLLADHAVDRGVSVVGAGTPTNHTRDQRGSVDRPLATAPLAPTSDGARLAAALGVSTETVRYVGGADVDSTRAVRAAHHALWPATWGYFLDEIVAGAVPVPTRDLARTLFVEHVRGDGPFASLCIGRQPYGVLPIGALASWRTSAGAVDRLAAGLTALLPRWLASGQRAAQVPLAGDALASLSAALGHQPQAVRVQAREAATVEIASAWWGAEWVDGLDDLAQRELLARLRRPLLIELARVGLVPANPTAITPLVHGDTAHDLAIALVGRAAVGPGAPPYVDALASLTDPVRLRDHDLPGAAPRTLLYLLLRHATQLVLSKAAADLVLDPERNGREVDVHPVGTATLWERLERPVATRGGRPVRELLFGDHPPNELARHRAALATLATESAIALERATRETIDVASHRLDAWITAVFHQRLQAMRAQAPLGAHVGAYGWASAPSVPAVPARDGGVGPARSQGFVLAPSLDHARTAAVLRAGFAARPTGDLAIDLSSRRVRRARWLLAELRAGRSLGELLGFQIERWLDDATAIQALRERFPIAPTPSLDPNRARLDGLAAYHAWRTAMPAPPFAAAATQLLELLDAVADLALAESVHQHVRGNPDRVSALLDSIATGASPPADPDVVATPILHVGTSYEVVWALEADAVGWPGDEGRARAVANAPMNAALAGLLGDPHLIGVRLQFRRGGRPAEIARSIADLDLCALDVGALVGTTFATSPLRAMFAAEAPTDAVDVEVVAGAALQRACLVVRAFADALRHGVPWTSADVPVAHAEWASAIASATEVLGRLAARDDDEARRHLAAVVGAPVTDLVGARALLREHVTRAATAVPSEWIRAFTGVGPTAPLAIDAAPTDVLAAPSARVAWMADAARVRPTLAALEILTTAAPITSGAMRRANGGVAIVFGPAPQATTRAVRIDAWREARPLAEITGAIAFHHDAPRARAPQAILVAVPADLSEPWSVAAVLATLIETQHLVTARLARPHDVWGPLLPALYLAENLDQTTASTTFADLVVDLEARA
jgi:hypothetical protein